jgi:hypothetical protein
MVVGCTDRILGKCQIGIAAPFAGALERRQHARPLPRRSAGPCPDLRRALRGLRRHEVANDEGKD